ncbi:RidA family protein [Zobellella aerophila]|uniref:RidA family protein n=1 Tax=Zobellella aerophila TaxID=870480 RepID=A0ABP6W4F8_9GAMM
MAIERYGIVNSPGRPVMSLGLACDDWVTVCATAPDRTTGVADQTKQVLDLLEQYLIEAGTSRTRVLSAMVWLRDIADYETMNDVWNSWVDPTRPPVRSCVQAQMARSEIAVEIRIIAAR